MYPEGSTSHVFFKWAFLGNSGYNYCNCYILIDPIVPHSHLLTGEVVTHCEITMNSQLLSLTYKSSECPLCGHTMKYSLLSVLSSRELSSNWLLLVETVRILQLTSRWSGGGTFAVWPVIQIYNNKLITFNFVFLYL